MTQLTNCLYGVLALTFGLNEMRPIAGGRRVSEQGRPSVDDRPEQGFRDPFLEVWKRARTDDCVTGRGKERLFRLRLGHTLPEFFLLSD